MGRIFFILKLLAMILLIWAAQILFLYQASKSGFNGWDDWGFLFYFDAHKGFDLNNFFTIVREVGTPYLWTQHYNIGLLKTFFGLHQQTIRYVELLFKSLAALSVAFLIFKITKDKLFAFLVVFFFITFPATAGPLDHIVFSGAYLTIVSMCVSVLFYIQSVKAPKKILLSSLFFFLALLVCPSRAYLIIPMPFIIELVRLRRSFRIIVFLRRLLIFYSPVLLLRSGPGWLDPTQELFSRFKQVASGNLYSLSLPFQSVSALFIDQQILNEILSKADALIPFMNPVLRGFLIINVSLIFLSIFLGLIIKGKNFRFFTFKLLLPTFLLEVILYWFGLLSSNDGVIAYTNYSVGTIVKLPLLPTIYQASLGIYYFIFGLVLSWEWWKYQRNNKILMIIIAAWFWSITSEVILYLTNHWYTMIYQSFDRYIIVCSLGAVVSAAGILVLSIKALVKSKSISFKFTSISLLSIVVLLFTWKNYQLLDKFYFDWNENQGWSAVWQDTMYQRFLDKFGKENLAKQVFIYIDSDANSAFNHGSFIHPIRFRIYYDANGNLIRNNCKAVADDVKVLKESYVTQKGEKGFMYHSACVDEISSTVDRDIFYPLSNFYAYKIQDKEFIDIKDKVLSELDQRVAD